MFIQPGSGISQWKKLQGEFIHEGVRQVKQFLLLFGSIQVAADPGNSSSWLTGHWSVVAHRQPLQLAFLNADQ